MHRSSLVDWIFINERYEHITHSTKVDLWERLI
jgi:hypothetical protein